jgi:hypothetical protein
MAIEVAKNKSGNCKQEINANPPRAALGYIATGRT